jgi:hypothetical protein
MSAAGIEIIVRIRLMRSLWSAVLLATSFSAGGAECL